MSPGKVPLKIYQGATFTKRVTWKAGTPPVPVDLTGCTALAHIRETLESPSVLVALSTANGKIVLGGVAGTIELRMSAAETTALNWATGVYDLEVTFPDGTVRRLMYGGVSVSPEITRG